VIAFDGIKSEMRRRLFGDGHEPIYTGAAVWRVGAPRLPEVVCGGLYQLEEFGGTVGEIRDDVDAESEVVYSPLSEVLLPTPWHQGRVVLGGDAAHACVRHPRVQFAQKASRDVLDAERQIHADNFEASLEALAAHLPQAAGEVDEVFNQAA
jgi:2-polyprenyl-6-methoxyphenol hydroxylase-like FAD-dependent oxidoreductase